MIHGTFVSSSLCEANILNDGWLNDGTHKSSDLMMVIKYSIWRNGNQGRQVIKASVLSLGNQQSGYGYWCVSGCLTSLFLLSCCKMEMIICQIINMLIYGAGFSYYIEVTGYQYTQNKNITVESQHPGFNINLFYPFLVKDT